MINVVKKRITIPPNNLLKNILSGLLMPLLIAIIPNPALKVVIIPARIKAMKSSFDKTSK